VRRFFLVLHAVTLAAALVSGLSLSFALELVGAALGHTPSLAARLGAGGVLALASWLALFGRVELARWDRPVSRARRLLFEEPYWVLWAGGLAALVLDVPALVLAGALSLGGVAVPLGSLFVATWLTGLALAFWGVVLRRRLVRTRVLELTVGELPPALDGFRIAHLSDLHFGLFHPREHALRLARTVTRAEVDLVALTGDYLTSGTRFHDVAGAFVGALRARHGVVASLGNHDYFDVDDLVARLGEAGARVLRNQGLVLEHEGARLGVAATDDLWTKRADVGATLASLPVDVPRVVLAHDPELFDALAEGGAALVLSGHTHWGQVGVPWLAERWSLGRLGHRYNGGLYRRGRATLWVHPGVGATGVPIRFGVAPEVTLIVLRAPLGAAPGATATPRGVDSRDSRARSARALARSRLARSISPS
jgi:predicted MPP superfamily phosphohydrolase